MSERLLVYWTTRDAEAIQRIRERFGIPRYTTINGISPAEISEIDMPLFNEAARRGFFQIMHQKWCKNGEVFVFQSR